MGKFSNTSEGHAGKLFHKLMREEQMDAINTMWPVGPTFYGNQAHSVPSVTDYLALPTALTWGVEWCMVWRRSAR